MLRIVIALLICVSVASAQSRDASYRASWGALVAGNAADTITSWGKREANPLAGDRFGGRAIPVKAAGLGAAYLIERTVTRRHPETTRLLRWVNFAAAGALGFVAYRNSRIPRTPHH